MKKTLIYITTAATLLTSASTFAYAAKDGAGERRGQHQRGPNIERMLEKLDTNGDGGISLEEIKAEQAELFKKVDTNSDESLTEEEFGMIKEIRKAERQANKPEGASNGDKMAQNDRGDRDGMRGKNGGKRKHDGKRGGQRGPGFDRLDADNSGTLTFEEFASHADKMFERFDRNSDGVINADDQKKNDDA